MIDATGQIEVALSRPVTRPGRRLTSRPRTPVGGPGRVRPGRVEADRQGDSAGATQNEILAQRVAPRGTVRGDSRDPLRGEWCTPKWLAEAVGFFGLDPFSNARSHVRANRVLWLERGDCGFGDGTRGSFRCATTGQHVASCETRVWIQPPYARGFVMRAFEHYGHTRFVALLRFDPRPPWFDAFYDASELVAVLRSDPDGRPFGFEPPPGVKASSSTFPHALFFSRAEDATPEALRHCLAWRKRPVR